MEKDGFLLLEECVTWVSVVILLVMEVKVSKTDSVSEGQGKSYKRK